MKYGSASTLLSAISAVIIAAAFLVPATKSLAAPTLLAQVPRNIGGSLTSGGLVGVSPTGASLFFGFGFNSFSGGSQPHGIDMDLQIGLDVVWPDGSTGSFDFDASNSSDFGQIASRLTDGANDNLGSGVLVLLDGTQPPNLGFVGAAGTGTETEYLGIAPDLNGASVDFIRLIVEEIMIDYIEKSGTAEVEYRTMATWQIWGDVGTLALPEAVPEPATLSLFGLGLLGFGALRRRKQAA